MADTGYLLPAIYRTGLFLAHSFCLWLTDSQAETGWQGQDF